MKHASPARRFRPTVEGLEDRCVPAVSIGNLAADYRITDVTTNPDMTWDPTIAAQPTILANDQFKAWMRTTLTLAGNELTTARQMAGLRVSFNIRWLRDAVGINPTVSQGSSTEVVHFGPAQTSQIITIAPGANIATWGTTMNQQNANDARFFMRVWREGVWTIPANAWTTSTIRLQTAAFAANGAAIDYPPPGNVEYRNQFVQALPLPGGGGTYTVYTVNSTDGATFQITGGNATGFSLLHASSDQVDSEFDEAKLAATTTFDTVFADGSNQVGAWTGTELIGALSHEAWVQSYTYTALPDVLPGNGQTINLSASSVEEGDRALWINLPTDSENTIGFLLVRNTPPTTNPDAYSVLHDTALVTNVGQPEYGVLHNDNDMDGDSVTVTKVNGTAIGSPIQLASGATVAMNANGSFTYTPATGWTGQDSFQYTISDGITTSVGNVTIAVTNSPPVANTDNYFTGLNQGINVLAANGLLSNDNDMDGDPLAVTKVNGLAANVGTTITLASGATLTVEEDGSFIYTPATGWSGIDSFTYEITDGLETSLATVYIQVFPY